MSTNQDQHKQQAAEHAVSFVQSGMVLGLGTGSTALYATRRIGALLRDGTLRNLVCWATSQATAEEARRLGIPLLEDAGTAAIDLTIDGADEADPQLNLIKGGGGALLREKIVAQASSRLIIVADDSKLVPTLGTGWAVPVEVLPFGLRSQAHFLQSLGATVQQRIGPGGTSFVTDQGNHILDCGFGPIADLTGLAAHLAGRAGIVEHGLFLGLATDLILVGPTGLRHITKAA